MSEENVQRLAAGLRGALTEDRERGWLSLPTIGDVLRSMPPPGERLATGLPTLDRCSRGGFARGRVYTFIGPPGRGKTVLLAQFGLKWARERGATVIGFFCDEGSWPAAVMMAQGVGFERTSIENDYSEIDRDVEEATAGFDVRLPYPDNPTTVLDVAEEWLAWADPDVPIALLVDSVQTVRCLAGETAKNGKERAEAIMATARRLARRLNAVVLLASKANRASFASKKDRIDPLAAGLDSSAIEYESDALFFLDGDLSDPEKGGSLLVSKNRPGDGTKPTLQLRFDRDRATLRELDTVAALCETETREQTRHAAAVEKAQGRILAVLKKHPRISGGQLVELVSVKRQVCLDARAGLETQGAIIGEPRPGGGLLWSLKP